VRETRIRYNIEMDLIIYTPGQEPAEQVGGFKEFFETNKVDIMMEAIRPICFYELTDYSLPLYTTRANNFSAGISLTGIISVTLYNKTLSECLNTIKENIEKAIISGFTYMPGILIVKVDFYENKFFYPITEWLKNLLDRIMKSYNKSLIS
jgi:abortive infection bacteriophage resistance protein